MPLQDLLHQALNVFYPSYVDIEDVSAAHKGHRGLGKDLRATGTHFNITLVSDVFENQSRLSRHRNVYNVLRNSLGEESFLNIHALSLTLLTPCEFQEKRKSSR